MEDYMKKLSNNVLYGIISLCITLASLVLFVLDWAVPLNIWIHPVLTLLFALFLGFGLFCVILGISKKSSWFMFLSTILLSLALFYVLIQYITWWVCLIIVVFYAICSSIMSVIVCGNKTEMVDTDEIIKNGERVAPAVEETKEELPKLKSFK
jgi:hypothetical protein